jgi:hypothetical protein
LTDLLSTELPEKPSTTGNKLTGIDRIDRMKAKLRKLS